jgi:hypothetical protein
MLKNNMTNKEVTKEIKSAISFVISQIKRGYTAQEACQQMKTSYGEYIEQCVIYHLGRWAKAL